MPIEVHAKIEGLKRLERSLDAISIKGKKKITGTVGYDAPYGIFVHEDLEATHTNGKAKFLETPARTKQKAMSKIVATALGNKDSLDIALFRALKLLLTESQKLVPVDTGFLKASGFIEIGGERRK